MPFKVFFSSDQHFGHDNIRRYCNRPFDNVTDMDEAMIDNWNSIVGERDLVYHLGDFTFLDPNHYARKLNGQIRLILGNHDRPTPGTIGDKIISIDKVREIRMNGIDIYLHHYAMMVWNKSHFGSYHLFGHSHGTLRGYENYRMMDVGVDANNFTPISFEQIYEKLKDKKNLNELEPDQIRRRK